MHLIILRTDIDIAQHAISRFFISKIKAYSFSFFAISLEIIFREKAFFSAFFLFLMRINAKYIPNDAARRQRNGLKTVVPLNAPINWTKII